MRKILLIIFIPLFLQADTLPSFSVYPLMDAKISSGFGSRKHPVKKILRHHDGVDLAAPEDAPIRAIDDGLVVFADPHGSYGNLVVIEHKNQISSHYGHCKEIKVKTGSTVKAGTIIATVGETGLVSGPHLHLEIRQNAKPLDPLKIFPGIKSESEG